MKVEGFIERIFFANEDTGVTAFILKQNTWESIKVMGSYFNPRRGEYVSCEGVVETDKSYGDQLKAEFIVPKTPEINTPKELKRFLKSIGSFNSDELYTLQQMDIGSSLSFLDIDKKPEIFEGGAQSLLWDKLKSSWDKYKGIQEIADYLVKHGVNPTLSKKIYKVFGADSLDILKGNPYKLLDGGFGETISFKVVDEIALKMGVSKKDPSRIQAGIKAVLKDSLSEGHTFLPLVETLNRSEKYLSIPGSPEDLILQIKEMRSEGGDISLYKRSKTDIRIALSWVRKAEKYCSEALKECLTTGEPIANTKEKEDVITQHIKDFEDSTSISLSDEQREAILMVFTNKVSIITGNPGTGKTTVCKCILYVFNKLGKTFSLASPTGRAAKRLAEVTGFFAETIHRLLEYSPQEGGFTVNEENPLPTDFLLVDEFSMVDIFLFRNLLKGFDKKNSIVIVGDADQLPSVQAGSVLKDCINSGLFGTKHLSKIYRQDDSNLIVLNAHAINRGENPKLLPYNPANDAVSDFLYIEADNPEDTLSAIERIYMRKIKEGNTSDSVQILAPKKEGVCGIKNINMVIQSRVNGDTSKPSIKKNGILYREGDRVLQLKNNYSLGIFNGDTGVIQSILKYSEEDPGVLKIDFGGGLVVDYEEKDLSNLQLAYAMTIHKSQGSEYPIVIMPLLTKEHYIMLYRNLFYTGITRAKRKLYLVGQSKAASVATKNVKNVLRYTSLFS